MATQQRAVALWCSALGGGLVLQACAQTQLLDLFPPDAAASSETSTPAQSSPATSTPLPSQDAAADELPPTVVVDTEIDLSRESITGRTCDGGDLAAASVVALSLDAIDVSTAIAQDCMHPGDELLLVWLQGSQEDNTGVGRYEFRTLLELAGQRLNLQPMQQNSGSLGFEGNVEAEQRVVVQRVPRFGSLWVREQGTLRAASWDGTRGGVLALRATDELRIDGSIRMDAAGFRGGASTDPAESPGQQGESISGLGLFDTASNAGGGGGGIGDQTRAGCQQDGYPGGGAGHAVAGNDAFVQDLCEGVGRGLGGTPYASPGRLFFGSGGGSAGTDNVRVDNPPGGAGGRGGGILWLNAPKISGDGIVSAEGAQGVGDPEGVECLGGSTTDCYDHTGPGGGGAGGSIVLESESLQLGSISVRGGDGGNGNDEVAGNGGNGAEGVVARVE